MSPKKRRSPRKHTVHPKDPRYKVNQYGRGQGDLVTGKPNTLLHDRLKSQCTNCGHIFYGSTIEHYQVCPKCKTKSGVPYHGSLKVGQRAKKRKPDYSKSTIIYANSEDEARSKVKERFGAVRSVRYLGKNDMGNPYYRVVFIPRKKSKTRSSSKSSSKRSDLEQEYVNEYRNTWGTNEGLSKGKISRMSTRDLKINIKSLKDFRGLRRS